MKKIFSKIFPTVDYLYIYQVLEYNLVDFLIWFLKNPFKRNLQKKHRLILSNKALAILIGSIFWEAVAVIFLIVLLDYSLLGSALVILLIQLFAPFFIILTGLFYKPLELYLKNKSLEEAKQKLEKLPNLKVVAITGSFGKTSTKDILYTLLWKKYYVVKTPKSFNTPLGIAQTILEDIKVNTQILIAEVGAYKIGEIAKITKLIKPQIGIITSIAPQHLERFGSLENIAKAKFELIENLAKKGIAILNSENTYLQNLAGTLKDCSINFYGQRGDSFYAADIKVEPNGTSFVIHTPKGEVKVFIPLVGEHHAQNFLAATIAAMQLGLTLEEIKERAKLLLPTPHRLEIRKQGNLTIIDNTFNTNPKSAKASLQLLKNYSAPQRIIITPGLVELGKESANENSEFATLASKIVDEFILVGQNAREDLLAGLNSTNFPKDKIHLVKSTQEGISLLSSISKPNAVVLLENDLPDQYF